MVTFLAEGDDVTSSVHFSRVIHHPDLNSGVTLGRGYDMKHRSPDTVKRDLMRAGISPEQAEKISKGARKSGTLARNFVIKNRDLIGEITRAQQVRLFKNMYPEYILIAEKNYKQYTGDLRGATPWGNLKPAIRDVLVDIVYQGFQGKEAMPAASSNNIDSFIIFLNGNRDYMRYEKGRNRIGYLNSQR